MIKRAARGQLAGAVAQRMGHPGLANKLRQAGAAVGDHVTNALKWEIPGTKNIRIMPRHKAHALAKLIGDHPDAAALAAVPIPFSSLATPAYIKAKGALTKKLLSGPQTSAALSAAKRLAA